MNYVVKWAKRNLHRAATKERPVQLAKIGWRWAGFRRSAHARQTYPPLTKGANTPFPYMSWH